MARRKDFIYVKEFETAARRNNHDACNVLLGDHSVVPMHVMGRDEVFAEEAGEKPAAPPLSIRL
jgi:hypothetical protein